MFYLLTYPICFKKNLKWVAKVPTVEHEFLKDKEMPVEWKIKVKMAKEFLPGVDWDDYMHCPICLLI